jgi:acyl-CoA thioesterase I
VLIKPSARTVRRIAILLFVQALTLGGTAEAAPIKLVALGDSLTAGLGLPASESFPAKLEAALKARGHDVTIVNAGVSGDTAGDGLARLDWSVGDDANAVIVELGANDALRGLDPAMTRATLDKLLKRLGDRHLPVLIAGMRAPRNLGEDFDQRFDAIYPDLATKYGLTLYPFFLDGLVGRSDLLQADGLHPNAAGVEAIVGRMVPVVEPWLARLEKPS